MPLIEFKGKRPQVHPNAFLAQTATLIGDVIVEEGASIWFGTVLRGDIGQILVGKNTSIQDNVVAHTLPDGNVVIGANVTVGHGAVLHNCTVEDGAMIGINAVVLDHAVVGGEAMVAAGSVVSDNTHIPPRYMAAGVPAESKKELSSNTLERVRLGPAVYKNLLQIYFGEGIGKA
ncbi:MAG: gamma carbonic anhydrase family protein, partial [Desulfotomaculaceae bacterium]